MRAWLWALVVGISAVGCTPEPAGTVAPTAIDRVADSAHADTLVPDRLFERLIPGTTYLRGRLRYALQEDGVGEKLWRMLDLSRVDLLYDLGSGTAYVPVLENGSEHFGLVFPDTITANAYGWEDEDGYPYSRSLDYAGRTYVAIEELAEKNGAFVEYATGYGDVNYYPASLLEFMSANYYEQAPFAGGAWRAVSRRRANH